MKSQFVLLLTVAFEYCEFPLVSLSEADEKVLFDSTVQVRYGDFDKVFLIKS